MASSVTRRNLFRGLAGSALGVAAASVAAVSASAQPVSGIVAVEMVEIESDGIVEEIVERLVAELRASGDDVLADIVVTRTIEIETEF